MLLMCFNFFKAKQKRRNDSSDNDSESDGMQLYMYECIYVTSLCMDRNTTSVVVNSSTYLHVLYKLIYYGCLDLEYLKS